MLLDLTMPAGMDGWTFYKHIRGDPELAKIPVVIHSALIDHAPAAVPTLRKPATTAGLLAIVREHAGP